MMQKKFRLVIFALGVSLLTFQSRAQETFRACETNDVKIVLLEPAKELNLQENPKVDFIIRRTSPHSHCQFWIGFERGFAPTYDRFLSNGYDRLDYDVFKTNRSAPTNLKSFPEAVSLDEVYTGEFPPGGNPNQFVYSTRPRLFPPFPGPFKMMRPGVYGDGVQMRLFNGPFPATQMPRIIRSVTQMYFYRVAALSIISLVDTGVPYTNPPVSLKRIDFGELKTGEKKSFDMVLLYNAGFEVTFASQNGSRLVHESKTTSIPYTMKVGSTSIALPRGVPILVASGSGLSPAAPNGKRIPVEVTIGSVGPGWAGRYADSISIVMTAP